MVQSLLASIYEAPASPMLLAAETLAQNSAQNGTALDADTFRMFVYKVTSLRYVSREIHMRRAASS